MWFVVIIEGHEAFIFGSSPVGSFPAYAKKAGSVFAKASPNTQMGWAWKRITWNEIIPK